MPDLVSVAPNYLVQSRTNYQLKHFVVGQHDTPEMRYRQILIEAKHLLRSIKSAEINVEIQREKIKRLRETGDKIDSLKAEEKEIGVRVSLDAIEAAKRELDYLIELSADYRHYTPEEIEANQPEYWKARLTRQAHLDQIAAQESVGVGNLMSLVQAGMLNRELTP